MFHCRDLDGDVAVLRTDYRVICGNTEHGAMKALAGVVIVLFSVGIPVYLAMLMVRRMDEYRASSDSDRFVARRVADELKITDVEAADAIRDVTTGREYSFLVNAYK